MSSDFQWIRIQLPIPFPLRFVNSYLILGDQLSLIDPGMNYTNSFRILEQELSSRGLSVEQLDRIIITHGHLDHFGLGAKLKELSGAKTYAHELELKLIAKFREEGIAAWRNYDQLLCKLSGAPPEIQEQILKQTEDQRLSTIGSAEPVELDYSLKDGERLSGDPELRIIHTPGHTPGHICIHLQGGILISGDHLLDRALTTLSMERLDGVGLRDYLSSLGKLRELQIERILPGHGNPSSAHSLLEAVINQHLQMKTHILEVLNRSKSWLNPYGIALQMHGVLPIQHALSLIPNILAQLELLEHEGRVESKKLGESLVYRALT